MKQMSHHVIPVQAPSWLPSHSAKVPTRFLSDPASSSTPPLNSHPSQFPCPTLLQAPWLLHCPLYIANALPPQGLYACHPLHLDWAPAPCLHGFSLPSFRSLFRCQPHRQALLTAQARKAPVTSWPYTWLFLITPLHDSDCLSMSIGLFRPVHSSIWLWGAPGRACRCVNSVTL